MMFNLAVVYRPSIK